LDACALYSRQLDHGTVRTQNAVHALMLRSTGSKGYVRVSVSACRAVEGAGVLTALDGRSACRDRGFVATYLQRCLRVPMPGGEPLVAFALQ
jgi:hypothetical protein